MNGINKEAADKIASDFLEELDISKLGDFLKSFSDVENVEKVIKAAIIADKQSEMPYESTKFAFYLGYLIGLESKKENL